MIDVGQIVKGKLKKKHILQLNDIMKHHGLTGNPGGGDLDRFEDFINYIAVRINKTPLELKENITTKELETYAIEVIKKDLLEAESKILAHHLPDDYYKEIKRNMNRLKMKSRYKQIPENEKKGKVLNMFKFKSTREQPV